MCAVERCKVLSVMLSIFSIWFIATAHCARLHHPSRIDLDDDTGLLERRLVNRNPNWSKRLSSSQPDIEAQQSELDRRFAPRESDHIETFTDPPKKIRRMRIHGNPHQSRRIPPRDDHSEELETKTNEEGNKVVRVRKLKKRPSQAKNSRTSADTTTSTTRRPTTTSTTTDAPKANVITASPQSDFGHIRVINREERPQKMNRRNKLNTNQRNPIALYQEQLRLRGLEQATARPHEHRRKKKPASGHNTQNERIVLDGLASLKFPIDQKAKERVKPVHTKKEKSLLDNHRIGPVALPEISKEPRDVIPSRIPDGINNVLPKNVSGNNETHTPRNGRIEIFKTKHGGEAVSENATNVPKIIFDDEVNSNNNLTTHKLNPNNHRGPPVMLPLHLRGELHPRAQHHFANGPLLAHSGFGNNGMAGYEFMNPYQPPPLNFNGPPNTNPSVHPYQPSFGSFYDSQAPQSGDFFLHHPPLVPYHQFSAGYESPGFQHAPDWRSLRRSLWDSAEDTESTTSDPTTQFAIPKFEMPSFDFSDKDCQTLVKEVEEVPMHSVPGYHRRLKREVKTVLLTKECFFPNGVPTKKPTAKEIPVSSIPTLISTESVISKQDDGTASFAEVATQAALLEKPSRRRVKKLKRKLKPPQLEHSSN